LFRRDATDLPPNQIALPLTAASPLGPGQVLLRRAGPAEPGVWDELRGPDGALRAPWQSFSRHLGLSAQAPAADLDRWTRFHELAATLPPEEQDVFHLVWYIGASQAEIATLLDCSERTVRRRWDLAKQRFKAALEGGPSRGDS